LEEAAKLRRHADAGDATDRALALGTRAGRTTSRRSGHRTGARAVRQTLEQFDLNLAFDERLKGSLGS
jgi:hypothetical protein